MKKLTLMYFFMREFKSKHVVNKETSKKYIKTIENKKKKTLMSHENRKP